MRELRCKKIFVALILLAINGTSHGMSFFRSLVSSDKKYVEIKSTHDLQIAYQKFMTRRTNNDVALLATELLEAIDVAVADIKQMSNMDGASLNAASNRVRTITFAAAKELKAIEPLLKELSEKEVTHSVSKPSECSNYGQLLRRIADL